MVNRLAIGTTLLILLLTVGTTARAEDSSIQLSGFVDAYYGYNFNEPDSRNNSFPSNNFDFNHNAISLSLAELSVAREADPVGFRLDLNFGQTTDFVHCGAVSSGCISVNNTEDSLKNIQEAYLSWATPIGLNIDFGKMVTHIGAEVIESQDNWNYTRGLLFCCAIPFYHAGLRANYVINEMLYVNGYLYNGWNNVTENNGIKTFGAQIGITPTPRLPIILGWIGPEKDEGSGTTERNVYEVIVNLQATETLAFMLDYNYGTQENAAGKSENWTGVAAYGRLELAPYTLALRYEYVDDEDNFMFGGSTPDGNTVQEVTVTAERTIGGNLLARLEYRGDFSDDAIFEDDNGSTSEDTQNRVVLGLVYMF